MDKSKTEVWLVGASQPIVIIGDPMLGKYFSECGEAKVLKAATTENEKIIIFVSHIAYLKEVKE